MADKKDPPEVPTLEDFFSLADKNNKEVVDLNTKLYYLNKNTYSRESKQLSSSQLETLIKMRNSGIPATAIANSLKIHTVALTKLIKMSGYRWNVSIKKYVQKDQIPRKIKKRLVERTHLHNIEVEPAIYRMIAVKAYLEHQSYSQIISQCVMNCVSKEIRQLALQPVQELQFHKLNTHLKRG